MTLHEVLKESDDYERHREIFTMAASVLIARGVFTTKDFYAHGGWVRSVSESNCYFIFAENATTSAEKFYLNVRKKQLVSGWEEEPYQL